MMKLGDGGTKWEEGGVLNRKHKSRRRHSINYFVKLINRPVERGVELVQITRARRF